MSHEPMVDLSFHLRGRFLPVDHGFALYGAISRVLPVLHEDEGVALKPISGKYIGNGLLDISPSSELVIRLHASKIPQYLSLAGKTLDVLGHKFSIGIPQARVLKPSPELYAHLVTTRNCQDQSRFEQEISKQMESLAVNGRLQVVKRRTFQVHGKQVVGYSVSVNGLNPQDSVILLEHGLGGRRKMGCGFFEVCPEKE
jgi:CRISPR-associated protein Cas6